MNKPLINPYLAIVVGVLAVSFSAVFVKISTAPPIIVAMYRLLFTFILLAPFNLKAKIKELRIVSSRDILAACLSGVFLALHFIFWFTSLKYTSLASSVVLVTTQPIFVVIGSWFFLKETVPKKALIGGALALLGSFYISATDLRFGVDALLGDLMALLGAVLVSCYLILGRTLRSRMSLSLYTFLAYGSSTLVLVLTSLSRGLSFYPYTLNQWVILFGLAFICTILGHTVFNWVLSYVQATVVAVAILGEPIGAIFWSLIFLKEVPDPRQIFGGIIILMGLIIFTLLVKKESETVT